MFNAKRLFGYLATGVMPEMTALDESLAEHDKKYHPDGYKEGDSCNKRETMAGGDGVDNVEGKEGEARRAKGEQRNGSSSDRGNGVTAEEDAAYLDAVKRGDIETARRMVREAAAKAGYSDNADWRMSHTAPNSKDDDISKSLSYLAGHLQDGDLIPCDWWNDLHRHFKGGEYDYESSEILLKAIKEEQEHLRKRDGQHAKIKMFRGVDGEKNKEEKWFRNGDWCTPSRGYAEGEANDLSNKRPRVIEQECSLADIYWDGNSISEFGFDDKMNYLYGPYKNNRKSADPVTYDDADQPIPLSRRFDFTSDDIRY